MSINQRKISVEYRHRVLPSLANRSHKKTLEKTDNCLEKQPAEAGAEVGGGSVGSGVGGGRGGGGRFLCASQEIRMHKILCFSAT